MAERHHRDADRPLRTMGRVERHLGDPAARAAVERALAAVDRELAANLEMTTVFDQTRQPAVLENGEFLRARDLLAGALAPGARGSLERLYGSLVDVEAAMERRGPANTLKDADRLIVEAWEGDAREAQRLLRAIATTTSPPHGPSPLARLAAALGQLRRP